MYLDLGGLRLPIPHTQRMLDNSWRCFFGDHDFWGGWLLLASVLLVAAKNVAVHPTMHSTGPHKKELPGPKRQSVPLLRNLDVNP